MDSSDAKITPIPCPICGKEPRLADSVNGLGMINRTGKKDPPPRPRWGVMCGASNYHKETDELVGSHYLWAYGHTKAQAILNWNRRFSQAEELCEKSCGDCRMFVVSEKGDGICSRFGHYTPSNWLVCLHFSQIKLEEEETAHEP